MGGFLRPDLQKLLAQGPSGVPDMPIFEEGAIPPVFGPEFPDPNELETIEMPVSEELGPVSAGQPVPPVKENRGDRLRALLGNFLQNFGEGLTAASRAPSGADFAAGIGAALSAPAERRRQQVSEDLLRANQRFRQETAQQQAEDRDRQIALQEQGQRDLQTFRNRQGIFRKEERLGRRFRDILESRREEGKRQFDIDKILLQDQLTRQREGLKPPTFSERRAAQRQRVNTMGAAFLVQTGGDVRAAIKLARENVKIDPEGFTAKNFAEIMRAIRSGNTSTAIEILRDALREQPPR